MLGRYLYKYVAFDKELRALDLIRKYSMKFSDPIAFNDPFDCNPYYKTVKSPQRERPELFALIDAEYKSPADRLRARARAVTRTNIAFDSGSFQKTTLSRVGIVSLSRTPWHVLMWSHYADKHSGFVVEFLEPSEFDPATNGSHPRWLVPFPVRYVTDRPEIKRWGELDQGDVENVFLAKSLEWAYEQEERVIDYIRGPGIYQYEPSLIKSVIAGCNISEEHFALLSSSVKEANKSRAIKIELYRAEIDSKKYRLNIPGFRRERNNQATACE